MRMIISANYASYRGPGRYDALKRSIESIKNQVDVVRVHFNVFGVDELPSWIWGSGVEFTFGNDFSDLGKFSFLDMNKDEIYLSCDDDLEYPPDYTAYIQANIGRYPVLSFHGRQLRADGNYLGSYYLGGHLIYSYRNDLHEIAPVDVVGTGVCAFDTGIFFPVNIHMDPHKKMSDLVFSLEAARACQDMVVLPHVTDWIKPIRLEESICTDFHMKPQPDQIKLAREIMELRGILTN